MTFLLVMTLVAAVLIALGIVGIVYPILPGSLAVLTGIVVWALSVRAPEGWWALGLGGILVIAGMLAQTVLTGRTLKRRNIPNRSILFGVLGAVIGMFVIPVVGLFIGFALGLLASEWNRQKDLAVALADTLAAMKSMGVGILVELAAALGAGTVFSICAITYFVTA